MKPRTEKYHYCRCCKSEENNFRLYIRTRKLQSRSLRRHNIEKRGFEAIGWYCKKCKMFETDEMISRRDRESIKDSLGIKSDEEYEKFIRSDSSDDIKNKVLSKYLRNGGGSGW
jgi:hypothetical protein